MSNNYENLMEKKRASGRTTRMIEHAKQLESEGKTVYIIAATYRHAEILGRFLNKSSTIKIETPSSVGNFNWHTCQLENDNSNCVVLIDHSIIEYNFSNMLKMWMAYDDPKQLGSSDRIVS